MTGNRIDEPLWRCIVDLAERNVDDSTIDALEALAAGTKGDGRQKARSEAGAAMTINTLVPEVFRVLGINIGADSWNFDIDDPQAIQAINEIATDFLATPEGRLHGIPAKRSQLDLFRGTGIKGLCELAYDYYRPEPDLSDQALRTMKRIQEIFFREIRSMRDPDQELQRKFASLYIEFLTDQLTAKGPMSQSSSSH